MSADTLASLLSQLDPKTARTALERIVASASSNVDSPSNNREQHHWDLESGLGRLRNIPTWRIRGRCSGPRCCAKPEDHHWHFGSHAVNPESLFTVLINLIPVFVTNTAGTELNQVWTNIIENAVDAMLGKGELRVRTFREDANIVVEIGDSGHGIPPEIKPHIFDPFFTTKGVGEGTGLGLNTVLTIVKSLVVTFRLLPSPATLAFRYGFRGQT